MSAAGRFHAWSTAAALTAAGVVAVASESMALAAIAIPAIAVSWAVFNRSGRSPVPRWIINILLIALTLNIFRQLLSPDHRPEDSITRLSQFLIGLMVIKIFENRRARDQAQALALGAMAAIGAVMTSVTLGVAIWTGAYIVSFTASVVLFQFVAGDARAHGHALMWDTDIPREPIAEDHAWLAPCRMVLATAATMIVLGSAVVFMAIPRDLGQQLIGAWSAKSGAATTGFSDQVQLGIDGVVSESDDIVMEIALELGGHAMLLPASQYFRGAVLDHYDPQRGLWRRSGRTSERLDVTRFPTEPLPTEDQKTRIREEEQKRQIVQRVILRNKTTDHLFALWKPVATTSPAGSRIYISPVDSTVRLDSPRGPVRYEVVSSPGATETAPPDLGRDTSFDTGPIREYAVEVLRRRNLERDPTSAVDKADEQRIDVLRQHLSTLCRYSLDLEAPPADTDPIEWFLFQSKRGSCEYFASALAAMCQSVGIEARVVTGFVTNEVDESTKRYIVRSKNAHAWVEALVPIAATDAADAESGAATLVRWKTYDAVPTASPQTADALSKIKTTVKRAFERLESLWLNTIISFDGNSQKEIFGASMDNGGWIGSIAKRALEVRGNWASRVVGTGAVFFATFALVSVALVTGRWVVRRTRRTRFRRAGLGPLDHGAREAHRIVARLDRTLRRAGIPRPAWVGALDHAREVARIDPVAGSLAERVARACYAARYGGASAADVERELDTIDKISARLRASRRAR